MQGLERLLNLTILELGGNRIRDIQGLENLKLLEELWLGRNRIEKIVNLDRFAYICTSNSLASATKHPINLAVPLHQITTGMSASSIWQCLMQKEICFV